MGYLSLSGKSHNIANNNGKRKPPILIIFVSAIIIIASLITLLPAAKKNRSKRWQTIRPPHEVSAMVGKGNVIWAGGRDGVYKIDKDTGEMLAELKCDIPLSYVRALLFDPSGLLWIAHFSGLSSYDGTACKTYSKTDGLPDERVNALYLDRSGRLWIGTWAGAAVYDGKGFSKFLPVSRLADEMVNVIMEDSSGGMWFGSYTAPNGGLSCCKNGQCRHFTVKEGLPHNNITSLLETADGELWVGTGFVDKGGAVRFIKSENGWSLAGSLSKNDGLAGNKVRYIYQDKKGDVWYSSEYDGIAIRSNKRWKIVTVDDGLSDNEVKVMLEDSNGSLWLGTRDGITKITQKELEEISLR
ncbi:MAG: transcriptional regulator [Nitrospirae bacterium]|nr:MAG: transcriptional regulator [Nitrospirota bacterium]